MTRVLDSILDNRYERRRAALFLTGIYTIACLALFRCDLRYADDQGRIAFGYLGFRTSGRYASALFAPFVNMGTRLTDLSPLTQILALLFCAIAAVIAADKAFGRTRLSLLDIIALIPFGLSPYFLGCLSFRFDAPYMALSVLFSALPLLVIEEKGSRFYLVTIIGILISAMTYQASLGIYPMLVLARLLNQWIEERESTEIRAEFRRAVLAYAIAILIYIIILIIIGDNPFTDTEGMIDLPTVIAHYQQYWALLNSDYPLFWRGLFILMAMIAVIICCKRASQVHHGIWGLWPIPVLLITAMCMFGLCPFFLGDSIFQARCMYGAGVYATILALMISTNLTTVTERARRRICSTGLAAISIIAVSWVCTVFATSYGNAMYEQNYYMEKRLTVLIDDLKDCDALNRDGQITKVQVIGEIGYSPILFNGEEQISNRTGHSYAWLISGTRNDQQLLQRLIPQNLSASTSIWADFVLYYYCGLPIERNNDVELNKDDLTLLIDNAYETIWGNEDSLLIELKSYDLQLVL